MASLTLGQPKNAGRLTVFPLITSNDVAPPYLLLDEALESDLATITEISESGSVPDSQLSRDALVVDQSSIHGAAFDAAAWR